MFVKLNQDQLNQKIEFINKYINAANPADGSYLDPNANVETKTIATLENELYKDFNIQINREILKRKIEEIFGKETAEEYIRMLKNHIIYKHDETSLRPYCVSVSMFPLLLDGMKKLGGESGAPKHLASYNGVFINFVFAIASQFAGAVATVEWLLYFDYFARKDYGPDYLKKHKKEVEQYFQQVVYSINQPAAARNYQSVFWNISIYDKYYFKGMFGDFRFPDGSKPDWESLNELQKHFLKWFNEERKRAILTFPVVTVAMLTTEDGKIKDKEYEDFISNEMAKGNSFFIFMDTSASALSSCCRLKNEIDEDEKEFSYTLGAGGVMTGSVGVMTLNLNRIIQNAIKELGIENPKENYKSIIDYVKKILRKVHKFQYAYRQIIKWYIDNGLLPAYTAGFITLNKQFSTIGINGLVEASEFMGFEITPNEEYLTWVSELLKMFSEENKKARKEYGVKFNSEFVPAENLAVKNYKWDKEDGYWVPAHRNLYSSYLYGPEDNSITALDKLEMHGEKTSKYLDGGQAVHINLEDYPTKEGFRKLMNVAALTKCNYWTTNVKITICNKCGYIDKRTLQKCPKCGSKDVDYATRVIGYLKRVSAFSNERRKEEALRYYERRK